MFKHLSILQISQMDMGDTTLNYCTQLKKSKFNVELEDGQTLIVFNTYSTKIIRFDPSERHIWETNQLKAFPESIKEWIIKNHFITTISDEIGLLLEEYERHRLRPRNPNFRILTTFGCNADCGYCFEKKDPRNIMTVETAKKCVDFISRYITNEQKVIFLEWFGGEPLMNTTPIDLITYELKCRYPDKTVISRMISNGSLFHQYQNKLSFWNLKTVQITLDGTRDNYNRIKRYNSDKYNFDVVLDNIEMLIEKGVKVIVRLNYTDDNCEDILKLIDQLHDRFGRRIRLYCSKIFSYVKVDNEADGDSEKRLFDKCLALGYLNPKKIIQRRKVPCGFSAYRNSLIITPDGFVCKCVESLFDPELTTVGTIYRDNLDEEKIEEWSKIEVSEKCSDCSYFPICMGSCKLSRLGHITFHCFRNKDQMPEIIRRIALDSSNNNFKEKGD